MVRGERLVLSEDEDKAGRRKTIRLTTAAAATCDREEWRTTTSAEEVEPAAGRFARPAGVAVGGG